MTSNLRVAVWQCMSQPLDVDGNLERLAMACQQAAEDDADVLVTPEMFLTGYDIAPDATTRLAEPADGPMARAVADITLSSGVAVVYGYPERGTGGRIYNAAQLVDEGRPLGRHHKLHLYGDLDKRRFTPGGEPPSVIELRGHQVAMLICYDVEFPESVRSAALRGARAVLVPTANMTGFDVVSTTLVPARAYENGVHVAYANYCGSEGETVYAGLSTICHPDGTRTLVGGDSHEALSVVELLDGGETPPYLIDRRDWGEPVAGRC